MRFESKMLKEKEKFDIILTELNKYFAYVKFKFNQLNAFLVRLSF